MSLWEHLFDKLHMSCTGHNQLTIFCCTNVHRGRHTCSLFMRAVQDNVMNQSELTTKLFRYVCYLNVCYTLLILLPGALQQLHILELHFFPFLPPSWRDSSRWLGIQGASFCLKKKKKKKLVQPGSKWWTFFAQHPSQMSRGSPTSSTNMRQFENDCITQAWHHMSSIDIC